METSCVYIQRQWAVAPKGALGAAGVWGRRGGTGPGGFPTGVRALVVLLTQSPGDHVSAGGLFWMQHA